MSDIEDSREGVPVTDFERGFRAGYQEAMTLVRILETENSRLRGEIKHADLQQCG